MTGQHRGLWARSRRFGDQRIAASRDPALLLLCSPVDITAIDAGGMAWESPRLVMDDLRIVGIDGDRVAEAVALLPALQGLRVTKHGHPRHPLYVPAVATLAEWFPAA